MFMKIPNSTQFNALWVSNTKFCSSRVCLAKAQATSPTSRGVEQRRTGCNLSSNPETERNQKEGKLQLQNKSHNKLCPSSERRISDPKARGKGPQIGVVVTALDHRQVQGVLSLRATDLPTSR
jgi:hypothetical protein